VKYTVKKAVIVTGALLLMVTPVVALADTEQALDDWKMRIDNGWYEVNVYVKEYSPKQGTTCYVASSKMDNYGPEANVSISCLKD
jgi:hypothetical protein